MGLVAAGASAILAVAWVAYRVRQRGNSRAGRPTPPPPRVPSPGFLPALTQGAVDLLDLATRYHRRIAVALFAGAFVFPLYFWTASDGLPSVQDQTEPFYSYLAVENLDCFGFFDQFALQDYATSSDPAAHPYRYTHNPDFPMLYSFLLLQFGVDSLPAQNFTAIFVLLLGFAYMYLLLSLVLRTPLAGLVVVAIAATGYLGSLV